MSLKREFMRKFVILRGRKTQYSKDNKPKGYVKIEVREGKGKIAVNVEGLKHLSDGSKAYKGYLLSKQQERIIEAEIGVVKVEENGRGKAEWNFNPQSVVDTGLSINKFDAVAIKVASLDNTMQEIVVPLAAYIEDEENNIDGVIQWMQSVDVINENCPQKEIDNNDDTHYDEQNLFNDIEELDFEPSELNENIESVEHSEELDVKGIKNEIETKDTKQGEDEKKLEHQQDDNKCLEEKEYIKIEANEDYFIPRENQKYDSEKKELPNSDNYNIKYENVDNSQKNYGYPLNNGTEHEKNASIYKYQISKYTTNILKFFEQVNPFEDKLDGYNWWMIEYDKQNLYRGFLPYYNYIVGTHYPYPSMYRVTTCQKLIQKHRHYIFGVVKEQEEVKYYVYGIPGAYTKQEHPYRGATGFTTWIQKKGINNKKLGYWLLHIDAETGKVASPLKPTRLR